VASLGAAEKYSKARHYDSPEFTAALAGVDTVYSAGFFLTHASETMAAAGAAQVAAGKSYALNLAAPFLCQFFGAQMSAVLPFADLVFGNESEAAAWGAANGLGADASVEAVARAIAALPHAAGKKRTVVITQGASSTVVVDGADAPLLTVPVAPVANVIDTNGAGDAFAGGFLAWRAKGASLEDAVKAGHWAAGHIITRSGCTFERSLKYSA
jgi:sugar/nucleoside kinase (ribokinase family)